MNNIPFIVAGLLLSCGLITAGIAVPIAIDEANNDTSNGGGYGIAPLEVEIIEDYGPDYVSFTPFTLQLQSYVANGDGELNYLWELKDGRFLSTDPNPTIEIDTDFPSGFQTIVLTVTDEDGDTGSDSFDFEVGAPWWLVSGPKVDIGNEFPDDDETNVNAGIQSNVFMFAFPRMDGPPPVEVFFTTTGVFCIGYIWDFGDGTNVSSGSSTSHIYHSSGNFMIVLYAVFPGEDDNDPNIVKIGTTDVMIYDEDPGDEVSVDMDIPDFPEDTPKYVFDIPIIATPLSGIAPLYVNFYFNLAPAMTTGFRWSFGDGGPPSFDRSTSHIFIEPGIYHVIVTYDSGLGNYGYGEIDITVLDPNIDVFTVDIEMISTDDPLVYHFNAIPSVDDQLLYEWTFDDGAQVVGQEITHELTGFGSKFAFLDAFNSDLGLYATAMVEFVIAEDRDLTIRFSIHRDPNDPSYRRFEALGPPGATNIIFNWVFGDGSSSNDPSPVKYYSEEGYFEVVLFATFNWNGGTRGSYYREVIFVRIGSGGKPS